MHLSRLGEALSNDNLLDCVYSTANSMKVAESSFTVKNAFYPKLRYGTFQSLRWLINYLSRNNSEIIHIHGNPVWESPTLLLLLVFKKKVVYTVHDQMILSDFNKYPRVLLFILRKIIIRKNIYWIAVNSQIKSQIESFSLSCKNISVIPAFIPSLQKGESLENEINNFINSKSKVISIYAHSLVDFKDKDLYGIDIALKAIKSVKHYYPDIGLIICIPKTPNNFQLHDYFKLINDLQISENVLLFLKPLNNPTLLWRKSDIVLRPTLSDGDSLVVREAINEGTNVIASDVITRPEGVILFKSENIDDLSKKIIDALVKPKTAIKNTTCLNYELIRNIYSMV